MSNEIITFSLVGRDAGLSAELEKAKRQAAAINAELGKVGKANAASLGKNVSSGLGLAQAAATGLTAAIGVGLVGAIGLAVAGMAKFATQIGDAAARQSELINVTTQIANVTGQSRDAARGTALDLQKELSKLSGGLVDTNISGKIANNLFDDILKAQGGDITKSIAQAGNVSNRLGFLSQTGVDQGQLQNALTDYISGGLSSQALAGRDAFIDSGLNKALLPLIEATGKDLKDLNLTERIDLFEKALNKAVPDEAFLEQAQTIGGHFNRSMFKLFDPVSGALSVERELTPIAGRANTVIGELTTTVGLLIGKDGVFEQISNSIGSALGLGGFDAMEALRDGLGQFNDFLRATAQFFKTFQMPDFSGLGGAIGGFQLEGIGAKLGNYVNSVVQQASDFLFSISGSDARALGEAGGEALGNLFVNAAALIRGVGIEAVSYLSTIDYSAFLAAVAQGGLLLVEAAGGVIGSFFAVVGAEIARIFGELQSAVQAQLANIAASIPIVGESIAASIAPAPSAAAAAPVTGFSGGGRWMGTPNFMSQLMATSAAYGFAPLGNAIAAEIRNKPAGSGLIVANSSEMVLTRGQQSTLAAALQGRSGIGSLTMNVSQLPGEDGAAFADRVIDLLSQRLTTRLARIG